MREGDPAVSVAYLESNLMQWPQKNRGMKSDNQVLLKLNSNIKDFIFSFKVWNVFHYGNVVLRYHNAQKDFASKAFNKISQLLYPTDSRRW